MFLCGTHCRSLQSDLKSIGLSQALDLTRSRLSLTWSHLQITSRLSDPYAPNRYVPYRPVDLCHPVSFFVFCEALVVPRSYTKERITLASCHVSIHGNLLLTLRYLRALSDAGTGCWNALCFIVTMNVMKRRSVSFHMTFATFHIARVEFLSLKSLFYFQGSLFPYFTSPWSR